MGRGNPFGGGNVLCKMSDDSIFPCINTAKYVLYSHVGLFPYVILYAIRRISPNYMREMKSSMYICILL